MRKVNNTLYIAFSNGDVSGKSYSLWKSDGTEAGTVFSASLGGGHRTSGFGSYAFVGDNLFYSIVAGPTSPGSTDEELRKVNINGGSGQVVKDIFPGT